MKIVKALEEKMEDKFSDRERHGHIYGGEMV